MVKRQQHQAVTLPAATLVVFLGLWALSQYRAFICITELPVVVGMPSLSRSRVQPKKKKEEGGGGKGRIFQGGRETQLCRMDVFSLFYYAWPAIEPINRWLSKSGFASEHSIGSSIITSIAGRADVVCCWRRLYKGEIPV